MKPYKFSIGEIQNLIKRMVILVDSREQKNRHILDYFDKHAIPYQVLKLDYGDYSCMISGEEVGANIYFHRDIVVERKNSLEELSGNMAQNREQFEREFLKAGNDCAKVYLMVEAPGGYSDIIAHNYKTQFKPEAFMASLKTWEHRFGANVQFIDKRYSGYYIVSTLQYFVREALK